MLNTELNYEEDIITYIRSHPTGVTIQDICDNIKCSRNTASKYLLVLKTTKKVKIRRIGRNKLYIASDSGVISRNVAISFIKGIVAGLKEKFPDNGVMFKEIAKNILHHLDFSLASSFSEEIKVLKENFQPIFFLKNFKDFYPYFDLFEEAVEMTLKKLDKNELKAIYRIEDSEFLGETNEFIYYYYGVCGILEAFFLEYLGQKTECNVEDIDVANGFVDISIKIITEKH